MTLSPERQSRLTDLIDALCDGTLTPEQAARLEGELLHDREAQWFYLRRVQLFGGLLWNCESRSEWEAMSQLKKLGPAAPPMVGAAPPTSDFVVPPIILDLSPTPHASPFSLQSPLGSFLFSYTVSALLLGIAGLIGLAYKVSV